MRLSQRAKPSLHTEHCKSTNSAESQLRQGRQLGCGHVAYGTQSTPRSQRLAPVQHKCSKKHLSLGGSCQSQGRALGDGNQTTISCQQWQTITQADLRIGSSTVSCSPEFCSRGKAPRLPSYPALPSSGAIERPEAVRSRPPPWGSNKVAKLHFLQRTLRRPKATAPRKDRVFTQGKPTPVMP